MKNILFTKDTGIVRKRIYRSIFVLLVLALSSQGFLPVLAADKKPNIDLLKKKVVSVGKLKFKRHIPIRYLDKPRMSAYVGSGFDESYPEELSQKEAMFIRLMGYVNRNIDVRMIRRRIVLDNLSVHYNVKTNELLALHQYQHIDYINAMVLYHELRNALQDIHFDVNSILSRRNFSDFDDRRLAVRAAMEGDAAFTMLKCGDMDAELASSASSAESLLSFTPAPKPSLLYREPLVLKQLLLMPHFDGLRFVNAVYKKKKWGGVNRILKRPPDSTEQILHPIKYLKKELPVIVNIDYRPEGFKLYHSGVIGEYMLNVLMDRGTQDLIYDYAQGWGGDTFHIFTHPTDPYYFLVWESVWDKDTFCSHVYSDFQRFLERRFKVAFKEGTVKGTAFIAGKAPDSDDYFFLLKTQNRIFYVRSNHRKQMNTFIYGGNYD